MQFSVSLGQISVQFKVKKKRSKDNELGDNKDVIGVTEGTTTTRTSCLRCTANATPTNSTSRAWRRPRSPLRPIPPTSTSRTCSWPPITPGQSSTWSAPTRPWAPLLVIANCLNNCFISIINLFVSIINVYWSIIVLHFDIYLL